MANTTSDDRDKKIFIYDQTLYIAECLDCYNERGLDRPIRMPFSSPEKRNAWVSQHTEDTEHEDIRVLSILTAHWRGRQW